VSGAAGFAAELERWPWATVAERIHAAGEDDVERALAAPRLGPDEVMALLSPAAGTRLEELAGRAHAETVRHFGRVVTLFAPLYLGNSCSAGCAYCGFAARQRAVRRTLSGEEILAEAEALRSRGIRHVLLLTGEDRRHFPPARLAEVVRLVRPLFDAISLEIYQMDEAEYGLLVAAGADGLVLYQETYDPVRYREVHLGGGRKPVMTDRLDAPERAARAGMRSVGLGALLGLSDARTDGFFVVQHARWLRRRYWRAQVAVSVPRLRPVPGGWAPQKLVDDRLLAQLLCVYRVALPGAVLVLSTREPAALRDALIPLGVTQISAGSVTNPGGYAVAPDVATAQFSLGDRRRPQEVAAALRRLGYDPVWKDWDRALTAEVGP